MCHFQQNCFPYLTLIFKLFPMSPGDNLHFPSRHFAIPALSIPALCHPGTLPTLPIVAQQESIVFFSILLKCVLNCNSYTNWFNLREKKKNLVDDTKLHIYLFQGLNVMENKYQKFHFPLGFLDFFMLIPSLANARDGKKHEKVSKPHGEMKFLIFIFHHVQPLKKVYM